MKQLLTLLLLCAISMSAHADWGEVGAAALCSPGGQSFQLVSTLKTSGWGDVPAPPKAHEFPIGIKQYYQCQVGRHHVLLIISVQDAGQGMGEGAGVIFIDKLMLDRKVLLTNTQFNWQVSDEPELSSVSLKYTDSSIEEKLCYHTDISNEQSAHCVTKDISSLTK